MANVACAASWQVSMAWDILNKGLSDSNVEHRRQAVLAAASIGATAEALKIIEAALLNDKTTLVRQTAAAALGQMKVRESIPSLQQALDDNTEVSFTAAKALWDMGDTSGRFILQQLLTGERSDRPGFIEQNLKNAKKKLTPAQLAMMGINEASGVLLGPASMGIIAAEEAIKGGKSGQPSGRPIAVGMLAEHPDDYTRPLLEWALTDKHSAVRAAAAKGLGQCGNAESIPKLQSLWNEDHAAVRYMAAASVIRLSAGMP